LECSAERLWASLLVQSASSKDGKRAVHVYLLTSWLNSLRKRFPSIFDCAASVKEVNSLLDVLDEARFVADCRTDPVIFLDALDTAFLGLSFDRVISLLKAVSDHAAVVARVHEECLSVRDWERLSSIAAVTCSLKVSEDAASVCAATVTYRKGRRIVTMETVRVDDSLRLFCNLYKRKEVSKLTSISAVPAIPDSTFDIGLNLRHSEYEAKQKISLPFEAAQNQDGMHLFLYFLHH
uniref:Elongator complex protein 5 n=1 Tax=Gongylonema pulchrum TaxID=637853 RepID=A0A183EI00_9BILA